MDTTPTFSMHRIIAILTGIGLITMTQLVLWQQQPITLEVADGLLGENWYRIELNGLHVGFMHNRAFKDLRGQYQFNSTTHFRMQPGKPNTVSKQLTFAPTNNYALNEATYVNRSNSRLLTVEVAHHTDPDNEGAHYQAALNSDGHKRSTPLNWHYSLHDFVALESWLATEQPKPGSQKLAKNPDFERLTVSQQGFRIAAINDTGYLLENDAPLAAHQIQLDQNFRPANLIMSGTFNFVATDREDAINLDGASTAANYIFAADRRIHDHTQLATLQMEFISESELGIDERLTNEAAVALQRGAPELYLNEELRYPVYSEPIRRIVNNQRDHYDSAKDLAFALTRETYRLLRYTENQAAGSVIEALRLGSGECTDFADVFTTLARAAEIPARTVYGLVYRDSAQPGFVFHAWNEVHFDNEWHAVDPTWNQTRIDATHIRLTDAQASAFMLAHSRNDLSISIKATEYFSS